MPAHFGGIDDNQENEHPTGWYHDVTVLAVTYVTDGEALAKHLPAGFEPTEIPTLTVYFCCNKECDWLAGNGYNMIGVNASVIFKGESEELIGSYALVIWENLTDPILRGRELQGIPKVFADIPDHALRKGKYTANASHFGHKIVNLKIENLVALDESQIAQMMEQQVGIDNPMSNRYIQSLSQPGSVLNEIITYPAQSFHKEVAFGTGEINWEQLSWEQNPTQFHIVNALKALPIIEYMPAVLTRGAVNLNVSDRPTRVLSR